MATQVWDAELYDGKHSFVAANGSGVLELLAARPGEQVLDLGCGTGDHVAELCERGVRAVGVDASAEMVARARHKYPHLEFQVADARDVGRVGEFDAVVSNAVLHWVRESDAAAASVFTALRPGGRFVAELGGHGNIATIEAGAQALRTDLGLSPAESPWHFPTVGGYALALERAGFEVREARLFDRPTPLDGPDGLANWVQMFGGHLLADVAVVDGFLTELVARLRPALRRDGTWFADYRRLRISAVRR